MEIKVKVLDKNTLELLEDAKKGDVINLNNLTIIDNDIIKNKIDNGFNSILNKEIENTKNKTLLEVQEQINKYNNEIILLKKDNDNIKEIVIKEEKNKNELEINKLINTYSLKEQDLLNKINNLTNELSTIKNNLTSELTNQFNNKLNEIEKNNNLKLETLKNEKSNLELKQVESNNKITLLNQEKNQLNELHKINLEKEIVKVISESDAKYKAIINEKDQKISDLNNHRANRNVKQTGEDLEVYCDLEMRTYMQNGFLNCDWIKDNKVIKDEEDSKGSKADFIFNIFADNEKNILLSNICLEMKDENPDSVTKKKNSDHFNMLDKNRNKKGCKYALLVSNLERDVANDIPMYKVREYNDMYVVRPGYLITFLNMIVSLSTNFKDLLLNIEKEKIEFKSSEDLINDFNSLKNTYLDKPLQLLEKDITGIKTTSNSIITAADKINKYCDEIKVKYIEEIENKLTRFNINKIVKKVDKI